MTFRTPPAMPDRPESGMRREPHIRQIRRLNQCKLSVFGHIGDPALGQRRVAITLPRAAAAWLVESRFIARDRPAPCCSPRLSLDGSVEGKTERRDRPDPSACGKTSERRGRRLSAPGPCHCVDPGPGQRQRWLRLRTAGKVPLKISALSSFMMTWGFSSRWRSAFPGPSAVAARPVSASRSLRDAKMTRDVVQTKSAANCGQICDGGGCFPDCANTQF
jgi:hypothetical protein